MSLDPKGQILPARWGINAAKFFSVCEAQRVSVKLSTGDEIEGFLLGVDVGDLIVDRDDHHQLLIPRSAIVWVDCLGNGSDDLP